jgi:stage III sporulation protein SpoIIIAA
VKSVVYAFPNENRGENKLNHTANSTDDLQLLLEVLPPHIRERAESRQDISSLIEIVLDLGRNPEARFDNTIEYLSNEQVIVVTARDLY